MREEGSPCRRDRTACARAWWLKKEWLEAQQSRCDEGITDGGWSQTGKRVSHVPCWGVVTDLLGRFTCNH